MSNPDKREPRIGGPVARAVLCAALASGAAACTSSPQYPIQAGERPGDGSVMAVQPRYPVSAGDAAQNAADRASQNGYPPYGAPPYAGPSDEGPPPNGSDSGLPPEPPPANRQSPDRQSPDRQPYAGAPPPADDEDSPSRPPPSMNAPVDSADLPPPGGYAPDGAAPGGGSQGGAPDAASGYPESGYPAPGERRSGDPNGGNPSSGYPNSGYPNSGYPNSGYPNSGYPNSGYPNSGDPNSGYPNSGDPSRGYPRSGGDAPPPPPPPADDNDVPPPPPQAIGFGGGRIVFGTDAAGAPALELAAYRHRHHAAAAEPAPVDDSKPVLRSRRHSAEPADAPATAKADTPYQTVVKPGEKLADVAKRAGVSREALAQLNAVKHPRHVKAGTVLKIPYRYAYEVQKGDTLYTIAHRFDQSPEAVARLNGLKTAPTLQPGQTLTLPPDAADQGKRDHAVGAGVQPVAAPEKLADAALRKAERHGRRGRHAAEAATEAPIDTVAQTATAEPARRGRHRRGRAVEQTTADATVGAGAPHYSPPLVEAAPPSAVTASSTPTAPVAAYTVPKRPMTGTVGGVAPTASATPATPPAGYYAGVRPSPATPGYRVIPPGSPGYAAVTSGAVASTYAAPAQTGRIADLDTPRYTPNATGAFSPSLGRERPNAPAFSGGALTSADIATAGRGRFIWPLRGPVLSGFGDKGTGQHNDGLDISAATGTGVRAAAAGEVVYAGNSIPGFGNLVLVKHSGGWVTAYAHLNRIEVRMRDSVTQGEEIGLAGQTGAVDRPQLHFEVRYAPDPTAKARPVDPALVLTTSG